LDDVLLELPVLLLLPVLLEPPLSFSLNPELIFELELNYWAKPPALPAGRTFEITMFVYELDFLEVGTYNWSEKESYFLMFIAPIGELPISRYDSQTALALNDFLIVSFYTPIILTFP